MKHSSYVVKTLYGDKAICTACKLCLKRSGNKPLLGSVSSDLEVHNHSKHIGLPFYFFCAVCFITVRLNRFDVEAD